MVINKSGVWGEIYAARYLRDHGYEIISANYRRRLGEIDIIARKGGFICFTEVKTRGRDAIARPAEAVDTFKQQRITATAKLFSREYPHRLQPRFDVCEVILDDGFKLISVNYIENAFDG